MVFCLSSSFSLFISRSPGYSNTKLGSMLALGSVLGFLLGTGLSSFVDTSPRFNAADVLWPVLMLQAAFFLLLLFFPARGVVTTLCYPLLLAFTLAVNTLNLKLCADFEHYESPVNYGIARSMGSAAYMVLSMLLGVWVTRFGVRVIPIAGLAVTALQGRFPTRAALLPSSGAQEAALRPCRTGAAGVRSAYFCGRVPASVCCSPEWRSLAFSLCLRHVSHINCGARRRRYQDARLSHRVPHRARGADDAVLLAHFPSEELRRRAAVFVYLLRAQDRRDRRGAEYPAALCRGVSSGAVLCAVRARDRGLCHARRPLRRLAARGKPCLPAQRP